MDQQLLCGYIREHSTITISQHHDIYLLCYHYYKYYQYHIVFGNFTSKYVNNEEIFNHNHQYFSIIKATSIQPITMCDAAILSYPYQYNNLFEKELKKFKHNVQICKQLGIKYFIVINHECDKHDVKQCLIHTDIDINNVQFEHKNYDISSKLSSTISQIINDDKLNQEKQNLVNKPFLMSIDDGFNKKSNNNNKILKVFTGQIIRGNIKIGDTVKFIKKNSKKKYNQTGIVRSIQMYGKSVGILTESKIGEYIGICIEFNIDFNAFKIKGLLTAFPMTILVSISSNIFQVEFKNVNKAFLKWILKFYGDNHDKIKQKPMNEAGYYPRINCSRMIETGYQRKGCILRRICLIKNNDILDSNDDLTFYEGRWGKALYWIGYDAKLVFEGDIFVTTYKESKFFGNVCMSYNDTKIGYGKIIEIGQNNLNTKTENKTNIYSLILSKWTRDCIPIIILPFDLKKLIFHYIQTHYPLDFRKLFNILSYDTDRRSRMEVTLNETSKNIQVSYGSNKQRGTYTIMIQEPISNNGYNGLNEITLHFQCLDDCFVNIGIANKEALPFESILEYNGFYELNVHQYVDDKLIAYLYVDDEFVKIKNKQCIKHNGCDFIEEGDTIRIMIDDGNFIHSSRESGDGDYELLHKVLIDEFHEEMFYFFIEFGGDGINVCDHWIRFDVN